MTGEHTPMTAREETAKEKYVELVTARKRKSMEDQGYRWFPDKQGGTWRDTLGRIVEKILSPAAGKKQIEIMEAAKEERREAEEDVTEETPYGICKGCGRARDSYEIEESNRRTNEGVTCRVCGLDPSTGSRAEMLTSDVEGLYLVSRQRIKANIRGTNMGAPKSRFSSFEAPNTPKSPYDAPEQLKIK